MTGYRLRVLAGAASGTEIAVSHELVIGREEQGAGNLRGDREISRRHARLSINEAGVLLVEDLGSTNGTFVNDRRLTAQRVLRAGDRVRVGASTIEVLVGERADAGATRPRPRPQPVLPTGPGAPLATPPTSPFPPRRADERRPRSIRPTGSCSPSTRAQTRSPSFTSTPTVSYRHCRVRRLPPEAWPPRVWASRATRRSSPT